MSDLNPKSAHQTLLRRVMDVAALHKRTAVEAGAGLAVWAVGLPLLAVVALQYWAGLPFYIRALVLPIAFGGLLWLAYKRVVKPASQRYGPTRAAMLVESGKPELRTRLVSAIETYSDLEAPKPRFDPVMVAALLVQTQRSTAEQDFRQVVDRKPARKQMMAGGTVLALWVLVMVLDPAGFRAALWSMATAWGDVRDLAQKAAGAHITVGDLDRAYLVGVDVPVRATQMGFHNADMKAFVRDEGAADWQSVPVGVDPAGKAVFVAPKVKKSFEVYFAAGRIESPRVLATVTERPRIASLTVEYQFPEYVRRAPVVQPRSDGNVKALFGSSVVLTIEANKALKTVTLTPSRGKPVSFSVGGRYANGVVKLDAKELLADPAPSIDGTYTLSLADDYSYTNADAKHAYKLVVEKDQPPKVSFVGLPHRSPADEPHVLEQNLGSIPISIKASDDYGISKITLHVRIEDLETDQTKSESTKERQFVLPPVDIAQLTLLRLSDLGATVGDRIVFWAEVRDAYDLGPDAIPHIAKTPSYRVAVVTQEEMFSEAVYRDDWSTQWYDSLKVATLTNREIPARMSPTAEPATDAAKKLLEASQVTESLRGSDQQLIQDYFDSLNTANTEAP